MRALTVKLILAVTLLAFPWATRCGAGGILGGNGTATVAWTAPSDPTVTGFELVWGLSSGDYAFSTNCPVGQTTVQVGGLITDQVYYFNVFSTNGSGTQSAYAGEVAFTNSAPPTNPPGPSTLSVFVASTNGTTSGNGGGGSAMSSGIASNTAAKFWGVPPFLTLIVSNGQPNLNVGGTVGAALMIQASTNPFSPDSWETMTNVALTNVAPVAQNTQQSQTQDALDLAFVPALQEVPVITSNSTPFQYFRAIMPYDYVILADVTLTSQGYTPRLIVVNMPGIVCDDACYVREGSSFIHYDRADCALQLEGSGPTIRAIATTLANSLNLDWTSASEFTYSNGLSQIVATVVQTEPPSSDPVPGKVPPSHPIVINF